MAQASSPQGDQSKQASGEAKLRVALLSMIEHAGDGMPPRAQLRVGPVTLARHHLALALALGCERVICMAPAFDAPLVALQHIAEGARASFHVLSGPRGLPALITAADEVIAFGDGLLAWPSLATSLLGAAPVVLVQPVDGGTAGGFERLDINHAAAAAMRIPGWLVERLAELPADCDAFSALQRIALQAGVTQRLLPADAAEPGRWTLVRTEAEAHASEAAWIRLHARSTGAAGPAMLAARGFARWLGPALLHAGRGRAVTLSGAAALALLALLAGWFGHAVIGLIVAAAGWVFVLGGALLGRVERASLALAPRLAGDGWIGWGFDGALALLIGWSVNLAPGQGALQRGFAPVMLLGLARLSARLARRGWARWIEDRSLLALTLAAAAAAGALDLVAMALGIAALAVGLAETAKRD